MVQQQSSDYFWTRNPTFIVPQITKRSYERVKRPAERHANSVSKVDSGLQQQQQHNSIDTAGVDESISQGSANPNITNQRYNNINNHQDVETTAVPTKEWRRLPIR